MRRFRVFIIIQKLFINSYLVDLETHELNSHVFFIKKFKFKFEIINIESSKKKYKLFNKKTFSGKPTDITKVECLFASSKNAGKVLVMNQRAITFKETNNILEYIKSYGNKDGYKYVTLVSDELNEIPVLVNSKHHNNHSFSIHTLVIPQVDYELQNPLNWLNYVFQKEFVNKSFSEEELLSHFHLIFQNFNQDIFDNLYETHTQFFYHSIQSKFPNSQHSSLN